MRGLAFACALAAAGVAHADAFDHIGDGAPIYLAARPVALIGALQRIGFDQLPAVQRLRRQLGGIDPFNPAILAAPGIDVAAPLVVSLFEPLSGEETHSRIVATLRDPATFTTFVDAIAASGQLKLQRVDAASALGKLGVVATAIFPGGADGLVRVRDGEVIVDVLTAAAGKKAPPPAELARRFPLAPARPFTVERGARRLFAPEAAAVAYFDGRRLWSMWQSADAFNRRSDLRVSDPSEKAAVVARYRARDKKCAVWQRAPTTFDDAALALTAAPDGLSLSVAWGTQAGPPLGGLQFHPVDDAGLDAELLGREATAVIALYAASLSPFAPLKRTAPFNSEDAFSAALEACGPYSAFHLLVRSWPQVVGLMQSFGPVASSPMAALADTFRSMRNVVVAIRDVTQAGPRGAIAATFDASARQTLETLLSTSGSRGAVTSIGKRSPTVYPLALPGFPRQVAAAIESLAGGKLGFTLADSDDSLTWAFRTAELPTSATRDGKSADRPPIARIAADLAALPKLGSLLNAGRDEQQILELLARLRRVDGDLVADGDLFRLTLRAPLKQ